MPINMDSLIAVNRFGLGAKRNELKQISADPRQWLLEQVKNPKIPKELLSETKIFEQVDYRAQLTALTDKVAINKLVRKINNQLYIDDVSKRVAVQVYSDQPFIERLVMFWSNHFTVSIKAGNKQFMLAHTNQFEIEAIRPNLSGTFSQMLLAVCRSPVMLIYLDNARSFGENSKVGMDKKVGLNENFAREILELHTLGVNGGYTQKDVNELAKIISGWSFDASNNNERIYGLDPVSFKFKAGGHEPGNKVLLGRVFTEKGENEGVQALDFLAKHPSTARHISLKLARHFISDNPPDLIVSQIYDAYMSSGGNLTTVAIALIKSKQAWQLPFVKYKNPYEYIISAYRLTDTVPSSVALMKSLDSLSFRPFNESSPAGYGDTTADWLTANSFLKRIEWAYDFASTLPSTYDPRELILQAFGENLSAKTTLEINQAPTSAEGIALLLASPEFQWR